MSIDDVHPNEMHEPHAFDESVTEALLAGGGREVSPHVADLITDMRVAYTSIPPTAGTELTALMASAPPVAAASVAARTFERLRASTLARIVAATAAVIAATGGLAVAQALPAPVQDLISHIGIGPSSHEGSDSASTDGSNTTTSTETSSESTGSTPTTTGTTGDHGKVVSGVAHDQTNSGCAHGAAVSRVASGGRSPNNAQESTNTSHGRSCTSTTTTADNGTPSSTSTTTSTTENTHGAHGSTTSTSHPQVSGGDQGTSHGSQPDHHKGGS